eukprot:TRINITY_DN145_c0_g1_i5.p1 TRINITY_DN145_c0_g1~~TRINITY_DN145_c0_g1_i5.p1  ORF type:complete len:101 (+),score=13.02 TRINITY_DN145_c0_g1_i5:94-396(+)
MCIRDSSRSASSATSVLFSATGAGAGAATRAATGAGAAPPSAAMMRASDAWISAMMRFSICKNQDEDFERTKNQSNLRRARSTLKQAWETVAIKTRIQVG